MWAFDGSISEPGKKAGTRYKHHSDCKKAAAKDYEAIVANLQSAAYDATRDWWGNGIYATQAIPKKYRDKVDAVVFRMVNRLEETLKECWSR